MNFVSRLPRAAFRNTLLLTLLIALLPIPFMRSPAHSQDPASPPTIPDPPAPMPLPAGTPQEQAVAFADAMDNTPDNVAAWLGLYDALDIPVIAPDGTSLGVENADPIGPAYWEVWYTSAARPDIGNSLADFGSIIALALEDTTHDYGALLLQDIRESASSNDPRVQLLALFAIERMTRGGPSPIDETTMPDQITLDPALLLVLGWSVIRAGVYEVANQSTSARPGDDAAFKLSSDADTVHPAQGSLSSTCMAGDNSDEVMMDVWTRFALDELRENPRGFANALKNVSVVLGSQVPTIVGHTPHLKEIMPAGYLLGLLMAGFQAEISASPAPFTRTRSQSEWGASADVTVTLSFSTNALPSGDVRTLCASYFAAKSFGGTLNIPQNGPINGGRIIVNLVAGVDRVGLTEGATTDSNTSFAGWTNSGGTVVTKVEGRPQKDDIPETATQTDEEYAVLVLLEMDDLVGLNGDTFFIVGGTTVLSIPAGANSPLIQALDQMRGRVRLGRYTFPFQDWELSAWRAYIGNEETDTIVCDFTKPISIYDSFQSLAYEIELSPTDEASGSYTQVIRPGDGTHIDFTGTYTLTHVEGSETISVQFNPTQVCATDPRPPIEGGGTVCGPAPSMSAPIVFISATAACPE